MKILKIRTSHFDKHTTTLYLDHTYFWTVFDDDVLLDADVLLDFLFEDQVLLELVQEHLVLANIATI